MVQGMENIARLIDHTLLKLDAEEKHIDKLCDEALQYKFAAVCVRLEWVELCRKRLENSKVGIACVIGFHEGTYSTQEKVIEARKAVEAGATELDMVIHISKLKEKQYNEALDDIKAVRAVAKHHIILKVIIETSQLNRDEIVKACQIAEAAGADFVKTSTGFCGQGATVENVALMKSVVGNRLQVKASGGVRTIDVLGAMKEAGASRFGTSNGVAIMEQVQASMPMRQVSSTSNIAHTGGGEY